MHAGVTVIGEINQLTAHLMNVLWMLGTFTLAVILGIVTEDVVSTVIVRPCLDPASANHRLTTGHSIKVLCWVRPWNACLFSVPVPG